MLRDIAKENYSWGKYFHYLFFTYRCENMDARAFNDLLNEDTNKTMRSYEIEHIVPLNAIENGSLKQYGFETDDKFNSIKNYFGNLLVLEGGLNSKIKDGGAQVKKETYKKSKYLTIGALRMNFHLLAKNA